jgi:hypothetical protein
MNIHFLCSTKQHVRQNYGLSWHELVKKQKIQVHIIIQTGRLGMDGKDLHFRELI